MSIAAAPCAWHRASQLIRWNGKPMIQCAIPAGEATIIRIRSSRCVRQSPMSSTSCPCAAAMTGRGIPHLSGAVLCRRRMWNFDRPMVELVRLHARFFYPWRAREQDAQHQFFADPTRCRSLHQGGTSGALWPPDGVRSVTPRLRERKPSLPSRVSDARLRNQAS